MKNVFNAAKEQARVMMEKFEEKCKKLKVIWHIDEEKVLDLFRTLYIVLF